MKKKEAFISERKQLFTAMFEKTWGTKRIWEHIRDGELIATPAFEGNKYPDANTKIMFVGRALNGWNESLGDCSTLENTVEAILDQNGALDTFIDERGFGDGPRKYKHENSKFFRLIKHILENVGESASDIEKSFYNDPQEWNQKFVWANLYCIAPKNPQPGMDANPSNLMIKPSINEYIALMRLYIDHYQPDVVVFITDIDGWFVKWSRQKSFKDIVSDYQEFDKDDIVRATGTIGFSKVIVCKRPDRFGMAYIDVENMAAAVAKLIL